MDDLKAIKAALERNVKAVSLRPAMGQGTAVTRARLRPGLACDVEEGAWRFTVGMSQKYGGSNAGPNPGVYGRAALGSCLAIGYAMWAARLGVPIDALEVEVQADSDVRGELGASDDVPPGYLAVRYVVRVESSAPEADVQRVIDIGDRHSSWLDDFTRAIPVRRDVQVTAPRG
ncbi:MAG: OsmC family protein [Gemmatimonadetes bacterium]|nr:OsmC family protein [Gemmatimonadota bacterium]